MWCNCCHRGSAYLCLFVFFFSFSLTWIMGEFNPQLVSHDTKSQHGTSHLLRLYRWTHCWSTLNFPSFLFQTTLRSRPLQTKWPHLRSCSSRRRFVLRSVNQRRGSPKYWLAWLKSHLPPVSTQTAAAAGPHLSLQVSCHFLFIHWNIMYKNVWSYKWAPNLHGIRTQSAHINRQQIDILIVVCNWKYTEDN